MNTSDLNFFGKASPLLLRAESASQINNRDFAKPNEDWGISDAALGFFLVTDGITRPHKEYQKNGASHALEVSRIFADTVYRLARKQELMTLRTAELRRFMLEAFAEGNRKIGEYNAKLDADTLIYPPGTVAFWALVVRDTLYYAFVGDCLGMLIRDDQRIRLGEQQTTRAFAAGKPTKQEQYRSYCNHIENPLGYGILCGDPRAEHFFRCSSVHLQEKDVLLLSSDGVANYLLYDQCNEFTVLSAEQMLAASGRYDRPPFADYADDKLLIKVLFERNSE